MQAAFGPLKNPKAALPHAPTIEPAQDGEREVTVRRTGDLNLVATAYHIPARTHADNAALHNPVHKRLHFNDLPDF